jgi:hypothetical protein
VFNTASGDAGVAASALYQVNYHTPSHENYSFFKFVQYKLAKMSIKVKQVCATQE